MVNYMTNMVNKAYMVIVKLINIGIILITDQNYPSKYLFFCNSYIWLVLAWHTLACFPPPTLNPHLENYIRNYMHVLGNREHMMRNIIYVVTKSIHMMIAEEWYTYDEEWYTYEEIS